MFYNEAEQHGDDFTFVGPAGSLLEIEEEMSKLYELGPNVCIRSIQCKLNCLECEVDIYVTV